MKGQSTGRVVLAAETIRALDLLDLPLPDEGVQAVVALFDGADRLDEMLILYRARFGEHYPEPGDLAHQLEEHSPRCLARLADRTGGAEEQSRLPDPVLPRLSQRLASQTYELGGVGCEVTIIPQNSAVGALVRLADPKRAVKPQALSRDFGAVHLDRSFEQNRLRFIPDKRSDTISTDKPTALARITNPLGNLHPLAATLKCEAGHNLVAGLTLSYGVDDAALPLHQVALPLWAAWGAGSFQDAEDQNGGHVALVWEDAQTRYELRSPYVSGHPVELEVQDARGVQDLQQRAAQAATFDFTERQSRFTSGKLLTRLTRFLELDQVRLGMPRDQVLAALPVGQSVVKRDFPGGLSVTFAGDPAHNLAYVARQMLIRFDSTNRLVELRLRYSPGSTNGGVSWHKELLDSLKKQGGLPWTLPATWALLWNDLPEHKPASTLYSWVDDVTLLTCQLDADGAEVSLRDCPVDHPTGLPLPRLELLPRGPEGCILGQSRSDLLTAWKVTQPTTTADGALVLSSAGPGPYDVLLVWFEKDRATRIVARHSQTGVTATQIGQMVQVLLDATSRQIRTLGWPRRQDFLQDTLQSMSWHDDVLRIRIFWQESDNGPPRMFTEWKLWDN